jgi:hypothetical protein
MLYRTENGRLDLEELDVLFKAVAAEQDLHGDQAAAEERPPAEPEQHLGHARTPPALAPAPPRQQNGTLPGTSSAGGMWQPPLDVATPQTQQQRQALTPCAALPQGGFWPPQGALFFNVAQATGPIVVGGSGGNVAAGPHAPHGAAAWQEAGAGGSTDRVHRELFPPPKANCPSSINRLARTTTPAGVRSVRAPLGGRTATPGDLAT